MKLIQLNRRMVALAVAIALLGGIAAWRLSGTAQAHRSGNANASVPAKTWRPPGRVHAPGSANGPFRTEPGGPIVCVITRAGIDGGRVRLRPPDSPRPLLRGCSERLACSRTLRVLCSRTVEGVPCVELPLLGRTRVLDVSGGPSRERLPVKALRTLARCGARTLPPGYAVPLGR
ncbi:MAG: hypothetical protein M3018_08310 [Actinomycetota bacterium]|nr:hypothetical protein [Actinomycetota bacterium]